MLRLTCCKFGPVPRLESANYYFYNTTTTTTTTTGEAEYYTAGAGCIMYNTYYLYNTYYTVFCIYVPWAASKEQLAATVARMAEVLGEGHQQTSKYREALREME